MKLLIIDPNISATSPSLKGVVRSLAQMQTAGFQIETWCWHCDDHLSIDRVDKLPRIGDLPLLRGFAFAWLARLRAWWRFSVKKQTRPDVVFTVAWYEPWCDLALVQFSPFDWELRQRMLGIKTLRDVVERIVNFLSLMSARRFLKRTTARTILCVSDAVRDDLRAVTPKLIYQLLPNSYDPARFNISVLTSQRESMRTQLGFTEKNVVFAFASAGHYRRKGFFLAVDALKKLRAKFKHARFLVIGGTESRLHALKNELDTRHADWRDWITFTGMVPDVEKYFAASDALLFPSYSEAFALVEVEANACGLPLFLTRHHGSEMILDDGRNGRFVEFDTGKIAAVLAEFVSGQWKPQPTTLQKALDDETYALRFIDEIKNAAA